MPQIINNKDGVSLLKANLKNKAIKYMVEDQFIKKLLSKLKKDIDKKIGYITRNIIFRNDKIQNNKILMLTQQGDFTCNEKFITLELLKENAECEIVWAVRKEQLTKAYEIPNNSRIKLVLRFSYEFYSDLSTAKVIIINSVDPYKRPLKKKRGQVVLQTWHGSLGIKRFDKNSFNGREWVQAAIRCGKETDYCISNSAFEDDVYRNTYWGKTPILRFGHARNDIFFWPSKNKELVIQNIINLYKLDSNTHYILYGPTFRDNHQFDCYCIDYDRLIDACQKKFGGKWNILVRFHLNVRRFSAHALKSNKNVIDVTDYPDIQELMLIADIAITDYSSWIYDFILLKRPGFIFATDISSYNNERGFYYKLESTPFLIATNNDELVQNISTFDLNTYLQKLNRFLDEKKCVDDGLASKRVVDFIKRIINI